MAQVAFLPLSGCLDDYPNRAGSHNRCSIDPSRCQAGESFAPANTVSVFDHITCSSVEDVPVGRCGDSNQCAGQATECGDVSSYLSQLSRHRGCTIKQDTKFGGSTLYSACLKADSADPFCVWDSTECRSDGQEIIRHHGSCNCGNVHVGACFVTEGGVMKDPEKNYFCAVSSDACGDNAVFKSAIQLKGKGRIDCLLCASLYDGSSSTQSSGLSGGAIAGIVIASLIVLGGVIVAAVMVHRRRNQESVEKMAVIEENVQVVDADKTKELT